MRERCLRNDVIAALLAVPIALCSLPAHAQGGGQSEDYLFDIPPQSVATALARFADLTKVSIVFSPQTVADTRTRGIRGRHTPHVALSLLLDQTSLGVAFTGPRSAVIYSLDRPQHSATPSNDHNLPLIALDTAQVRASRIIGRGPPGFSSLDYARRAQMRIKEILAARFDYRSAPYRGRIGITSDARGHITEVLITRGEGEAGRDSQVRALLIGRDLDGPPPDGIVQPLWFRISTDDLFRPKSRSDGR